MGLLKSLAGTGMFGLAGLAATHKLGGLAKSGMFGIGGAILAGGHHGNGGTSAEPQLSTMPQPAQFADEASYLAALKTWASGQGQAMPPNGQPVVAASPFLNYDPTGQGGNQTMLPLGGIRAAVGG